MPSRALSEVVRRYKYGYSSTCPLGRLLPFLNTQQPIKLTSKVTTATQTTTSTTHLSNMLSFFRKNKSTPVMANANTSETTLVTPVSKSGKRKTPRQYEPYQAEFTGMGLGGMPSMGGMSFLEPPAPKREVKMVPAQPFRSQPRASFVDERLSSVKGMFQLPAGEQRRVQ